MQPLETTIKDLKVLTHTVSDKDRQTLSETILLLEEILENERLIIERWSEICS